MKKYIVVVFIIYNISANAQNNEIRINFAPVYNFKGKTFTDIRDSIDTYYSFKKTAFELSLAYCRTFKNDYYAKFRYGIDFFHTSQPEKRKSSSSLLETEITRKYINHLFEIESGKKLTFEFITFIFGVGLNFEYLPPNTQFFNNNEFSLIDNTFLSAYNIKVEYPSSNYFCIYLNTSLYFKLHKALSLGFELNNGFSYAFGKGVIKYTYDYYDSNLLLYKKEIQEDKPNITIFSSNLLDLQLGIRFIFPDIKKKDKK